MQRIVYSPFSSRTPRTSRQKEFFLRELPSPGHAVDYYLVRDLCIQYGAHSIGFFLTPTLYVNVNVCYNQVTVYLPDGGNVTATFHIWYDVLSKESKKIQLSQMLLTTLQEFGNILDVDKLPLKNALYRDHCRIQSNGPDGPDGSIPRWMHRSKFLRKK